MKLLLTVLLLVHTIQCLPEFSRDACLQTINSARAEVAEKFQIANMNSLNYNKRLEPVILKQLSFVDGCPSPSIISHKNLDIYLNVRGQEDLIVELLSGTNSTMLACVKSKCNGEPIVSIVTDKVESAPIRGPPGSECPSSANSIGLCVLENVRGGYTRKGLWDAVKDIGTAIITTVENELNPPVKVVVVEKHVIVGQAVVNQSAKSVKESAKGFVSKEFLDELVVQMEKKSDKALDYDFWKVRDTDNKMTPPVARPSFDPDYSVNPYESRPRARRGFDFFDFSDWLNDFHKWLREQTTPPTQFVPIRPIKDIPLEYVEPNGQ